MNLSTLSGQNNLLIEKADPIRPHLEYMRLCLAFFAPYLTTYDVYLDTLLNLNFRKRK